MKKLLVVGLLSIACINGLALDAKACWPEWCNNWCCNRYSKTCTRPYNAFSPAPYAGFMPPPAMPYPYGCPSYGPGCCTSGCCDVGCLPAPDAIMGVPQ